MTFIESIDDECVLVWKLYFKTFEGAILGLGKFGIGDIVSRSCDDVRTIKMESRPPPD
jgi:hypothetical protein